MTKPYFFNSEYKFAFLANMAGRLRDMINEDCAVVLKDRGIVTPVTDASLMLYIANHPHASIADIARGLDYSHQRTAARVSALEKLTLVNKYQDPKDTRCKRFILTPLGERDLAKLQQMFNHASQALETMLQDLQCDLMAELLKATEALKRVPLSERIQSLPVSNGSQTDE